MRRLWLVALLSCGGAPPPQLATIPEATIPLTETSLGPLTGSTRATLIGLRAALRGYTVIPANVGTERRTLEYQVFDGDAPLFTIIPSDNGAIRNVHVVTPKVTIAGRTWRVGAPFTGVVNECDCWGDTPVCFNKGEHVAVAFEKRCRARIDARGRRALEGAAIKKLVWSPQPFGGPHEGGPELNPDGLIDL